MKGRTAIIPPKFVGVGLDQMRTVGRTKRWSRVLTTHGDGVDSVTTQSDGTMAGVQLNMERLGLLVQQTLGFTHLTERASMTESDNFPTWEVIHGDCLDLICGVKDESVPLVVTDPPYFTPPAQFVSGRSSHKRSLSNLSLLDHFYADWFDALIPKMTTDGCLYIFCDSQSYPLFYAYLYERVKALRLLVWDRGTAVNGYSWRYRCQYILFAQMFDAPAVRTGDPDLLACPSVPVKGRTHPAEKPIPLLRRLIEKSSNEGDLVLDCFAGSGSTGAAALAVGRRFLGFELNKESATAASALLEEASDG